MSHLFVGDRFVRVRADDWLDLATGRRARVAVHALDRPWPIIERALAEEIAAPCRVQLVDYGRLGDSNWFEARCASADRDGAVMDEAEIHALATQVIRDVKGGASPGMRCVHATAPPRPLEHRVLSRIARGIREHGFVVVRPELTLPDEVMRELPHRHIALVSYGHEREAVSEWIRRLATCSPRGHAIVFFRDHTIPALVRDRGSGYGTRRSHRHGRPLAMSRWPPPREAAAGLLVAAGEFEQAEAMLAAVAAEGSFDERAPPDWVQERLAQVRFWQGRFHEAAALLKALRSTSVEAIAWRGLVAWARGEADDVRTALGILRRRASVHDRRRAFWICALQVAAGGHRMRIRRLARRFLRGASSWPADLSALGCALAADAFLAAGFEADAARAVRLPRRSAHLRLRTVLDDALLDWMRGRCSNASVNGVLTRADRFIQRSGADGLTRWGLHRRSMNVLHGLSALLQLVHDADDEQVALRRGCSWVREHAGADAVGIVTNEGGALIVTDGLARVDLDQSGVRAALAFGTEQTFADGPETLVATPMRYGGVTIGFAVVKGQRDRATSLADAGTALASACAPALRARLDALAVVGAGQGLAPEILGTSPAVGAMRECIARAATTTFSVLVEGDSGTGKELVARALHRLSPRRDRRFCAINCAALTDELVEAELFGYVRGAFTGAIGPRTGLFEEAHGGTVFLDEVSELSPRGQAKLLRVLQEREIRRLGENAPRSIDVRVVAATNQPLAEAVGRGRFREDLLFRLAVVRIRVPRLQDRIEDVPLLAQAFWKKLSAETGKRVQIGSDAIAALCRYPWPGNVRELQNIVAALIVAAPTRGRVGARHVEQVLSQGDAATETTGQSLDGARQAFERRMVTAALARHGGRRTRAAIELGISRQGLTKAMKRLGLGGVA